METREIVRKYRGSLGVWLGATLVLALVVGPGVVDDWTGSQLVADVQAGAAVDPASGAPGTVSVTWTSNQNAANLTVWVEGPADVAGPTSSNTVVLDEVNETAVFEERGATARDRTVTVWVLAVNSQGDRTVVVAEELQL